LVDFTVGNPPRYGMYFLLEEPATTPRADEKAWPFGTGHGELRLWVPASHLVVVTMIGRGDGAVMPGFLAAAPPAPNDTVKQAVFFDMIRLEHYESPLRVGMTEWLLPRRTQVVVHCLFRSKLVAMGVSVANLALGGIITTYTARSPFQAAFERAQRDLTYP
jgi:hypothetical protein